MCVPSGSSNDIWLVRFATKHCYRGMMYFLLTCIFQWALLVLVCSSARLDTSTVFSVRGNRAQEDFPKDYKVLLGVDLVFPRWWILVSLKISEYHYKKNEKFH